MTAEYWVGVATGFGVAIGLALLFGRPAPPPEQKLPVPGVELHARVGELEERVTALAKARCINVTTSKLDVGIYPRENLGVGP